MAEISPGDQVLDIAAGRGANLFPAVAQVRKDGSVTGIDLTVQMVERTSTEIKTCGIENAHMLQMDVEDLDFEAGTFNRALCGFALFFFPDLDRALGEIKRVLAPGGVFAASTIGFHPWLWFEQLLMAYQISTRGRDMLALLNGQELNNPTILERRLVDAGFEDVAVSTESVDDTYTNQEEWWTWLMNSPDAKFFSTQPAETVAAFKDEAFKKLEEFKTDDGIRVRWQVLLVKGRTPS